jgi:S1-C subfamily serine protease
VKRPGALAAIAAIAALLGGVTALVIGKAVGWTGGGGGARTVLVPLADGASASSRPAAATSAARPLAGNGFDPAEIYRARAGGVVTIYALFGNHAATGEGSASQGSGFVVSEDGYVLTNSHVITTAGDGVLADTAEAASQVYVEFQDGDRVEAKIVGWDLFSDVGLVEVNPADHPLAPVPLGDSSAVVVGEPVAAIGSPFGQLTSLSVGVVSATQRSIDSLTSRYNLVDAIQTDAPINRGNSGGPLFDARGEVIGINAQIRSQSGTAEGVGFAVPINTAKRSMNELIKFGRVRYAWLGVSTETVTPSLARHFGIRSDHGAAVQCVVGGSPAQKAGLRSGSRQEQFEGIPFSPGGDVILAVNEVAIVTSEDVGRVVSLGLLPGERVSLTVLRGSERLEVGVTLGERDPGPSGRDCS